MEVLISTNVQVLFHMVQTDTEIVTVKYDEENNQVVFVFHDEEYDAEIQISVDASLIPAELRA